MPADFLEKVSSVYEFPPCQCCFVTPHPFGSLRLSPAHAQLAAWLVLG